MNGFHKNWLYVRTKPPTSHKGETYHMGIKGEEIDITKENYERLCSITKDMCCVLTSYAHPDRLYVNHSKIIINMSHIKAIVDSYIYFFDLTMICISDFNEKLIKATFKTYLAKFQFDQLHNTIADLNAKVTELQKTLNTHILYAPGGSGAIEAEEDWKNSMV